MLFLRRRTAAALATLAVCCSACGHTTDSPGCIFLSIGFDPALRQDDATWTLADREVVLRHDEDLGGVWLETALERDSWQQEQNGYWTTKRPETLAIPHANADTVRLFKQGEEIVPWRSSKLDEIPVGTAAHYSTPGRIALRIPSNEEPTGVILQTLLERGRNRDGRRRIVVGNLSGDGLDVWPGERAVVHTRIPEERSAVLNRGPPSRSERDSTLSHRS